MRQYLSEHSLLPAEGFKDVDWTALGDAMTLSPPLFQLWTTKHLARQCATGQMMHKWGFWEHLRCPCCQQDDETVEHLIRCPHDTMQEQFTILLLIFQQKQTQLDTHPKIAEILLRGIMSKTNGFTYDGLEATLREAAEAQNQIRWQATLEGRLAKQW